MTWLSSDFIINNDGEIKDQAVTQVSDQSVREWRRYFTEASKSVWIIVHDTPDLVVMFTRIAEEPYPRNTLRISVNHRIK